LMAAKKLKGISGILWWIFWVTEVSQFFGSMNIREC
jgi:hypothetical protein